MPNSCQWQWWIRLDAYPRFAIFAGADQQQERVSGGPQLRSVSCLPACLGLALAPSEYAIFFLWLPSLARSGAHPGWRGRCVTQRGHNARISCSRRQLDNAVFQHSAQDLRSTRVTARRVGCGPKARSAHAESLPCLRTVAGWAGTLTRTKTLWGAKLGCFARERFED